MKNKTTKIDLVKLGLYMLKRCWLIILCAAIGFGFMYVRASKQPETYTSSGTMYVYNANPNTVNYGYTSSSDLYTSAMLVDTYMVIIKSDRVLDKVAERLLEDGYQGISNAYVSGSLSMASVNDTSLMRISCTTNDPKKSQDICNAVLDVAPSALMDLIGAGTVNKVDSANLPTAPNYSNPTSQALRGALIGAVLGAAVLALIFFLNRKVTDPSDLTENYTPPVLASVKRDKRESEDPAAFMLNSKSPMEITESYSKLRMNLFFTMVDKESHSIVVTSAISGEGKSTITANLAISCAMSGKRVLLVDADMRRACQRDIFHYKRKALGLSDVLVGRCEWQDTVIQAKQHEELDIMPAGQLPPNPAELLDSKHMRELLKKLEEHYDLILLDAPPVNIVSDPLALSDMTAGSLFVVRQGFTDHRELKKALNAAELTGMDILGFVFYGEKVNQSSYYSRRYYRGYYHKYDTRANGSDGKDSKGSKDKDNRDKSDNKDKSEQNVSKRSGDEALRRAQVNENDPEDSAVDNAGAADGADLDSDSGK